MITPMKSTQELPKAEYLTFSTHEEFAKQYPWLVGVVPEFLIDGAVWVPVNWIQQRY